MAQEVIFIQCNIQYIYSQETYSYDTSYHRSQDNDYVCDSQEDYSDSSDSYCSSFIGDSELDDDAFYFDDQGNLRYFIERKNK